MDQRVEKTVIAKGKSNNNQKSNDTQSKEKNKEDQHRTGVNGKAVESIKIDLDKDKSFSDKNNNTIESEFKLYVQIKEDSLFFCSKTTNIRIECFQDKLKFFSYTEIDSVIANEKLVREIELKDLVTASIIQNDLSHKNTFLVYFYDKSKLCNIRFHADNRWECERYCSRLKEYYLGKTVKQENFILKSTNESPNNNDTGVSIEVAKWKSIFKVNAKVFYIKSKLLEELIIRVMKQRLLYYLYHNERELPNNFESFNNGIKNKKAQILIEKNTMNSNNNDIDEEEDKDKEGSNKNAFNKIQISNEINEEPKLGEDGLINNIKNNPTGFNYQNCLVKECNMDNNDPKNELNEIKLNNIILEDC